VGDHRTHHPGPSGGDRALSTRGLGAGGTVVGGDAGTGLVGSIAALLAFLVFLLFAVQLLVGLYATTVVTDAAADGAHRAAASPVDWSHPTAAARACRLGEARTRDLLGEAGRRSSIDCRVEGEEVALRVRAPRPRFLLPGFGGPGGDEVDRTVRARVEVLR
jgi:hypothetical protein